MPTECEVQQLIAVEARGKGCGKYKMTDGFEYGQTKYQVRIGALRQHVVVLKVSQVAKCASNTLSNLHLLQLCFTEKTNHQIGRVAGFCCILAVYETQTPFYSFLSVLVACPRLPKKCPARHTLPCFWKLAGRTWCRSEWEAYFDDF
ncbi:MAG: hypothetical protein ACK4Q5_09495 [Saprospiraceae bacterium]